MCEIIKHVMFSPPSGHFRNDNNAGSFPLILIFTSEVIVFFFSLLMTWWLNQCDFTETKPVLCAIHQIFVLMYLFIPLICLHELYILFFYLMFFMLDDISTIGRFSCCFFTKIWNIQILNKNILFSFIVLYFHLSKIPLKLMGAVTFIFLRR